MSPEPSPEPLVQVEVAGKMYSMLVDTGASLSTVRNIAPKHLSKKSIYMTGLTGTPTPLQRTADIQVKMAGQALTASLVVSPRTPVHLLGRDLLIATNATIQCSPDGLTVTWPNGHSVQCSAGSQAGCWLAGTISTQPADSATIYWGLSQWTLVCFFTYNNGSHGLKRYIHTPLHLILIT